MAVRAIGKAVEVFRRTKKTCPIFQSDGAITYDERILSFKGLDRVSLWTMSGRMLLPLVYGEYQSERFDRIKGQVDLVYREGKFFLYATVDLPEPPQISAKAFLGVDLGIVNLATDSDGNSYSGAVVEKVRRQRHAARQSYQKTGTKSAKRRLKLLAKRETNFRKNENHIISKALVQLAKDTSRGIGLEELKHIRDRTTVRAKDRARHCSWAFAQLQAFITYKAKLAGIPVLKVDARNTSRTCSSCGFCSKQNRKDQANFTCLNCNFSDNADKNAARNIRDRATINWPELAANVDSGLEPLPSLAANFQLPLYSI